MTSICMKMKLHAELIFHMKGLIRTWSRFETEAQENSEMAYSYYRANYRHKNSLNFGIKENCLLKSFLYLTLFVCE